MKQTRNVMHDMCVFIFPAKIFAVSENNRTFAKGIAHCGYGAHNTHISYGKERKTNRWAYWSNWLEKDYKPQEKACFEYGGKRKVGRSGKVSL